MKSRGVLFPEDPRPLPEAPSDRGVLGFGYTFRTGEHTPPGPVRFARGYEPFALLAERAGADPEALAADLGAFGTFVRAHREALADPALAEAAAVFLGNVIAALHPRATWRSTPDPEIGTDAVSMPVRDAVASILDEPGFAERMPELPARWRELDDRHDEVEAAMATTRAVSDGTPLQDVPGFERPFVQVGPFLDEHGEPIPYGFRWEYPAGPPADAYSRVTHPERFAPLIETAEALVAHLERWYDVDVDRTAEEIMLRPREGAPIRITRTDFPGLHVRAGLLLHDVLPDCGCDACDETAASAIESLERTVLGVVAGGFTEHVPDRPGTGAYHLRTPDGGGVGSGGSDVPEDAIVGPDAVAALGGAAWPAWPRRA